MKGYLLGLGAMLVGAGLMFVLMHGEVSADSKPEVPEPFVCSSASSYIQRGNAYTVGVLHCKTKKLDCAIGVGVQGYSCVKKGMF